MVSPLWGPAYPTGSGIFAYELASRLAREGHQIDVYTSTIGNFDGFNYPQNLNIIRLKTYGMVWGMNPLANILTALMREDYDVVHAHSYIYCMSNMAAAAKLLKRFGLVLHIHGGIDYSNMGSRCGLRLSVKDTVYDRTVGLATVKLADKVVSVSKSDVKFIKEKFGVDATYIPNAVNTDMFSLGNDETRTVTYVGKLEPWKGIEDLLQIFRLVKREYNDVKFVVAGEGSQLPLIKKFDGQIEFLGHIPHEKMPQLYHRSAVTILSSYMEGAPTTCIESLSCGVPCVATDVGDTNKIVVDGRTGYIVKPGQVKEAADRIIGLLSDNAHRLAMGESGLEHVIRNYSYASTASQMMEIYKAVM